MPNTKAPKYGAPTRPGSKAGRRVIALFDKDPFHSAQWYADRSAKKKKGRISRARVDQLLQRFRPKERAEALS